MTLVETVSFSTSDFTDNFLTCPTCLAGFDESDKSPKLLPCSHTVCRECLDQIIRQQSLASSEDEHPMAEAFRCPVCRKAILLPRGGVNSLPPSYIVNRLMDLLKHKKQRDFIPKCKTHSYESLLFCETCDCVFCPLCDNSHQRASVASDHIVVPFATALKRMTEILNYKCAQCRCSLDEATNSIRTELARLEQSVEAAGNAINDSFQEIGLHLDQRRTQLIDSLKMLGQQKTQALNEQLKLVNGERSKIEVEWLELEANPDIRAMSAEIERLNLRLDSCQLLAEPRENSFLRFEFRHNTALCDLSRAISSFGRLRVSNTYPPLCTAKIDGNVCGVTCSVHVTAIDYNGNVQNVGGDPLSVSVTSPQQTPIPYQLSDSLTGSYKIVFLPQQSGCYRIDVRIFNRPIHGSPLQVIISDHNNPIWSSGGGQHQISMPTSIAFVSSSNLVCLSTGQRQLVKISTESGEVVDQLKTLAKLTYSTVGFCFYKNRGFLLDWRRPNSLLALELDENCGISRETLIEPKCDLLEPVLICAGPSWDTLPSSLAYDLNLFIYDSAFGSIAILGPEGQFVRTFSTEPVQSMTTLPSTPSLVFSAAREGGTFLVEPDSPEPQLISKANHSFISLFCPNDNELVGARSVPIGKDNQQHRSVIEVYEISVQNGRPPSLNHQRRRQLKLLHSIDSFSFPLHYPCSICGDHDGHLFCADMTTNCVKKYRYK